MVQPLAGAERWYPQGLVERVNEGEFSLRVVIGDEETPDNTEFRLVIVVARSRAEARGFKPGKEVALPDDLPRSEIVEVKLKKDFPTPLP